MILQGYKSSRQSYPMLVIGNMGTKFGKSMATEFYQQNGIQFAGSVYDQYTLNNLRYYSARYFHGHSVGGTNPSLLEAMACQCNIAAHNNAFNKTVLQNGADYFLTADEVASIIDTRDNYAVLVERKKINMEKIRTIYNMEKNIDDYERLMLQACGEKTVILKPAPARSI